MQGGMGEITQKDGRVDTMIRGGAIISMPKDTMTTFA